MFDRRGILFALAMLGAGTTYPQAPALAERFAQKVQEYVAADRVTPPPADASCQTKTQTA